MHPNEPTLEELLKLKKELETSDKTELDVKKLNVLVKQIARLKAEGEKK